jgi:hypothetical protein
MKVINSSPTLSDTSDFPLPVKADRGQIKVNEEDGSQDPSEDNIFHQLNELQGIAPELKGNKNLKVYQISALLLLLYVCGHSDLACFVKRVLFVSPS